MKIKKIVSSVVLATTLLLSFPSTAFAITVSSGEVLFGGGAGPYYWEIHQMVVSSAGVVHALDGEVSSGLNHLYYRASNETEYAGEEIDTANTDTEYYASMALDSSGYPGVAWREWDSVANTGKLFYRKYNGTDWGTTVTVATGLDAVSSVPALGFYRNADNNDADYATIISCGLGGEVSVAEYKATSADLTPSFAAPVTISSDSAHQCSAVDLFVSSTDTLYLVTAPNSQSTTAYSFFQQGGSWGNASTVFTGVEVQNTSNIFMDVYSNGVARAVIVDDAAADGTDYILTNEFTSGSWGTQESITSGVMLGQERIDITYDQDNNIPYVFYFDNTNSKLKYAYKSSSWTIGDVATGLNLTTAGGDYANSVVSDYDQAGAKIILLSSPYATGTFWYTKYELTDLVSVGGVPEFSTIVYVATVLLLFGMVYWKNEGGNMQSA